MIAFVSDICVKPLQYSQVFFVQRYMVSCNISVAFNKNSFRMNKKRIMNISHQTYFCSGFWPFIYRLDFIIIFAGSRSRCLIERYCINFCQHAKKMSGSDSVRFSIAHLTFQFMCQLNTFERTAFPINSHLKLERTIQAHSQEYQYTMQAKQIDAIHVAIPKCVFDLCEPIICTLHNAHNRTEQNRT